MGNKHKIAFVSVLDKLAPHTLHTYMFSLFIPFLVLAIFFSEAYAKAQQVVSFQGKHIRRDGSMDNQLPIDSETKEQYEGYMYIPL